MMRSIRILTLTALTLSALALGGCATGKTVGSTESESRSIASTSDLVRTAIRGFSGGDQALIRVAEQEVVSILNKNPMLIRAVMGNEAKAIKGIDSVYRSSKDIQEQVLREIQAASAASQIAKRLGISESNVQKASSDALAASLADEPVRMGGGATGMMRAKGSSGLGDDIDQAIARIKDYKAREDLNQAGVDLKRSAGLVPEEEAAQILKSGSKAVENAAKITEQTGVPVLKSCGSVSSDAQAVTALGEVYELTARGVVQKGLKSERQVSDELLENLTLVTKHEEGLPMNRRIASAEKQRFCALCEGTGKQAGSCNVFPRQVCQLRACK